MTHPLTVYNMLMAWNRREGYPLSVPRINRALGIVLRHGRHRRRRGDVCEYIATTLAFCSCSDYYFRRVNCKHQIAFLMQLIMEGRTLKGEVNVDGATHGAAQDTRTA